jgi:hypothetical protein
MTDQKIEVVRQGVFDCQVCIPATMTDGQILDEMLSVCPAGTEYGWQIRREGCEALNGDPERVQCAEDPTRVHVMLEA